MGLRGNLESTVNVVGSGPNGLTAAAVLAGYGFEVNVYERNQQIGGAAASASTLGAGTITDLGAAAHPFAYGSPAFRELGLTRRGLTWKFHEYALGHPLDRDGSVFLKSSVQDTVEQFLPDARVWQWLHGPVAGKPNILMDNVTGPLLRVPPNPLFMARFGLRSVPPAAVLASSVLRTRAARALFAGSATHSMLSLRHPFTSGFAVLFGALGQSYGWPVAEGGSGAIVGALEDVLRSRGVRIHTGQPVHDLRELPKAGITMLDLTPRQVVQLAGTGLDEKYRKSLKRWRYGTSAFKVDYLLDGPVPWLDPRTAQAGTVHVGGDAEQIIGAESEVARGRMPERPFVMVVQPSSADSTRAPQGQHVLWAYAHVPHGYNGPAGKLIDAQLERFAPGFRDRILHRHETTPQELEVWNPNLVGGDIGGGSLSGLQQFFRPVASLRPYNTGSPGIYLCSSSTPPGGGVHGMGGWHAAHAAVRDHLAGNQGGT